MLYYTNSSTDEYRRYTTFGMSNIIISNDSGANSLIFSENGITETGYLFKGETLELLDVSLQNIFVKSAVVGNSANFRIWSYAPDKNKSVNIKQTNNINVPRNLERF